LGSKKEVNQEVRRKGMGMQNQRASFVPSSLSHGSWGCPLEISRSLCPGQSPLDDWRSGRDAGLL
jgi:hypothetical protein